MDLLCGQQLWEEPSGKKVCELPLFLFDLALELPGLSYKTEEGKAGVSKVRDNLSGQSESLGSILFFLPLMCGLSIKTLVLDR